MRGVLFATGKRWMSEVARQCHLLVGQPSDQPKLLLNSFKSQVTVAGNALEMLPRGAVRRRRLPCKNISEKELDPRRIVHQGARVKRTVLITATRGNCQPVPLKNLV